MFKTLALAGAVAIALSGAAQAQDRAIGEDSPFRFRDANRTAVLQNQLQLFELNRAGYFDQIRNGNMGALAGAGGLLGASSGATNNSFTFVDQSTTTNNCSSSGSGVGSSLTCGRGDNTVTNVDQTSSGNTQNVTTDVSGNTITNRDNQTTGVVNNNGGN